MGSCKCRRLQTLPNRHEGCKAWLLLVCAVSAATAGQAEALNLTLESIDGSYYPNLDGLLNNPNSSFIVGNTQELQAFPKFNVTTGSFPVTGKVVVVSESFFSVFSSSQVRLWELDGNGTAVVPAYFDVASGGELLLLGFTLYWGAARDSSRLTGTSVNSYSSYPSTWLLLDKLRLYVELSGTGKLQLLRTTIEGLGCDALQRIYSGLTTFFSLPSATLTSLSGGIVPDMRLVYPYLFIKYGRLGPIWVEDCTLSCAATADLSPAACLPKPPAVYNITSHDDLVAALAAVEDTDVPTCVSTRTVLRLLNSVTLDVARWPRSNGGLFLTSNITFQCDLGQNLILDFNGGLNLFKLRAAAYVRVENLVVANLPLAPVGVYVVPLWSFSFPRDLSAQTEGRLHMINTTGVIPADEFMQLQYWATLLNGPQTVAQLAGWQRLIQDIDLIRNTNTTMVFSHISGMGITCSNIVLTTLTYGVTLLQPSTGVNQLLGTGFRSGPPYTIAVYGAAQLLRIFSLPDFRIARLAEQDGLTNGNTTDVLLILQSNITLDQDAWPEGLALTVKRKFAIQGRPFANIVLDLRGRTAFLGPTVNGLVQFGYLKLVDAGWQANYTAENAARNLPVLNYLQLGIWPVDFDRTGLPRVQLTGVTLLLSGAEMDLLFACLDSYNSSVSAGDSPLLRGGLTSDMCQQIMPQNAQVANSSRVDQVIAVTAMQVSSFHASEILLAVDPNVTRPDLVTLLEGGYPSMSSPSASSTGGSQGPNVAAIVGGTVGGAMACVILAAAAMFYTSRRSRASAQEQQLRGLQAKQAHQLEELSKTNPLAQLILDHLAGKDPGATQLVVGAGKPAAPSCAGSNSGGGGDGGALTAAGTGLGGVGTGSSSGAAAAASAGGTGTGGGGSDGATPSAVGSGVQGEEGAGGKAASLEMARHNAMPVNIAATDLAELFKHLTILGVANLSNTVADNHQPDSRGSRARSSPARVSGTVQGIAAGAPKSRTELSALSGFAHALAQRLHLRGSGNGHHSGNVVATAESRGADGNRLASGGASGSFQGVEQLGQGVGCVAGGGGGAAVAAAATAVYTAGDAAAVTKGAGAVAAASAGGGKEATGSCAIGAAAAGAALTEGDAGAAVAAGAGGVAATAAGSGEARLSEDRASSGGAALPTVPEDLPEQLTQSPVLEELLRLSLDLAGEIDDNQLTVTEVVASGGFGTVYKGMWHNLPVAVKIVLFSTASVNRRIALQEAALSKSISHPNIIATYAVDAKPMAVLGRAGGTAKRTSSDVPTTRSGQPTRSKTLAEIQEWRLYIIQEFADGGTLRRALDRGTFHDPHSGLPRLEMLLDIAQGVASALGHLHSKSVVHGDLNPKNVLLKIASLPHNYSAASSRTGGVSKPGWPSTAVHPAKAQQQGAAAPQPYGTPAAPSSNDGATTFGNYPLAGRCGFAIKVADFGLSVKMEHSHISGLRQGTPFYAAPELTMGIFSRAADMYAFGVLLWELYWGRPIWVPDARAPGGYAQHEDFPLLPHDCPPEYVALVADCLQLNHLQRPGFDEILGRLRALAHALVYGPGSALTSGTLTSLDSIYSLSMPGLPMTLHPSQLYAQQHSPQHALTYAQAQGQAHAQAQAQAHAQQQQQQQQQATAAARRQPVAGPSIAAAGTAGAAAVGAAVGRAAAPVHEQHKEALQQQQQQQQQWPAARPRLEAPLQQGGAAAAGADAAHMRAAPLLAASLLAAPQHGQQHHHQQYPDQLGQQRPSVVDPSPVLRKSSGSGAAQTRPSAAATAASAMGGLEVGRGLHRPPSIGASRVAPSAPPPVAPAPTLPFALDGRPDVAVYTVADAGTDAAAVPVGVRAAAAGAVGTAADAGGVEARGRQGLMDVAAARGGRAAAATGAVRVTPGAATAEMLPPATPVRAAAAAAGTPGVKGVPGIGVTLAHARASAAVLGGTPVAVSAKAAAAAAEAAMAEPVAGARAGGGCNAAAAGQEGRAADGVQAAAIVCGSTPCAGGQGAVVAAEDGGSSGQGAAALAGLSSPLDTRGMSGQRHAPVAFVATAAPAFCSSSGAEAGGSDGGDDDATCGSDLHQGPSGGSGRGRGVAAVAEAQCGEHDDDFYRMLPLQQNAAALGLADAGAGGGVLQWVAMATGVGAGSGSGPPAPGGRVNGAAQAVIAAAALEVIEEEEVEDAEDNRRAWRIGAAQ